MNTSFGKSTKSHSWRYREKLASDLIARLAATNQQTNRCDLALFNTIADVLEEEEIEGKESIGKGDDLYYLIPAVKAMKILEDRGLPLGDLKKHCNYKDKSKDAGRPKGGKLSPEKTKKAKKKVGVDAVAFIERGKLNHSQITNELLKHHRYKPLTKKQVRLAVKEKCLELNRSDLILGHSDYKKAT